MHDKQIEKSSLYRNVARTFNFPLWHFVVVCVLLIIIIVAHINNDVDDNEGALERWRLLRLNERSTAGQ